MANITGGCLCGAVRYTATGEAAFAGNCHCRDCRRVAGSAYMPVLAHPRAAVRVTGMVNYFKRKSDSGQFSYEGFCSECGSRLVAHADSLPGMFFIQAGSLDEPNLYKPQFDMYTSSAARWDLIDPALPKFERMPPA